MKFRVHYLGEEISSEVFEADDPKEAEKLARKKYGTIIITKIKKDKSNADHN